MDPKFLRDILSCFDANALERYVKHFYEDRDEPVTPLPGKGAFYKPILGSYGKSVHLVFQCHHLPYGLFLLGTPVHGADPVLVGRLRRIALEYRGVRGQWGMVSPLLVETRALWRLHILTNHAGIEKDDFLRVYFPAYERAARRAGIRSPLAVGTYDSFIQSDVERVERTLVRLVNGGPDGISIIATTKGIDVSTHVDEAEISAGLLTKEGYPLQTVIQLEASRNDVLFREFAELLKSETRENVLEAFLRDNYSLIFGEAYDRIDTQVWLRMPELDISNKARRIDIFLRNAVQRDWELFEIKRPVRLTGTYRDVPVLLSEVHNAIQQVRNYERILRQESVRQKFREAGLEYFEPELRLVIGRSPAISLEQWRWLKHTNEGAVRLITYDELLQQMRLRLNQRIRAFEEVARVSTKDM